MEIVPGTIFNTVAENNCEAITSPDAHGDFLAFSFDGVECQYHIALVCGYGHPDHHKIFHVCEEEE